MPCPYPIMATVRYNGDTVRAFGRVMKTGDTFGGLTDAEAILLLRNPEFERIAPVAEPTHVADPTLDETPAGETEAAETSAPKATPKRAKTAPMGKRKRKG